MHGFPRIVLVSVLAALAACRAPTYEGQGDLIAIDPGGATIAHEAIAGLMGAMTMRFPARPTSILEGAQPGTRVRFVLERDGDALTLVQIEPVGLASGTTPATHDHRPHHAGVVTMIGLIHVEVVALPTGLVRAYLSDLWRRPLSVRGVTGTVRLALPGGNRTLRFEESTDALEARTAPFTADSVLANVALVRDGLPLEMNVLLDLTGGRAGASVVPETGCVTPSHAAESGRSPRCTISFGRGFAALGVVPDRTRMIVAIEHAATTVWSLPDAALVMGFEPAPSEPVLPGQHQHDPRVIAVSADGTATMLAIGARLARFETATGRFVESHPGPSGMLADVAWAPDGKRLLVAASGDGKAYVLDAGDAHVITTVPVEGEAIAVALDASGRYAAVATAVGTIALADLGSDAPPRVLTPSLQPVAGIGFAPGHLVAAGTDGTLRVFDVATGNETARIDVGARLVRLAIAPDGASAATADRERVIRIHALPAGTIVEPLTWHRANVAQLAWGAGPTLVSGDTEGELAVWDVGGK
jgi:YVTN family beta-propeller protein